MVGGGVVGGMGIVVVVFFNVDIKLGIEIVLNVVNFV